MNTLLCFLLIATSLIFKDTRLEFVEKVVSIVEKESGVIEVVSCPFEDVEQTSAACKAYQIGVTAGTTKTTFSPADKIEPYQAFLFIGRALQYLNR